jgi:hypothetical protein
MDIGATLMELIRLVVGFDQREAIAYHVFAQSVLLKSSNPITFSPLSNNTLDYYNETHFERSSSFKYL